MLHSLSKTLYLIQNKGSNPFGVSDISVKMGLFVLKFFKTQKIKIEFYMLF